MAAVRAAADSAANKAAENARNAVLASHGVTVNDV